jgi:hypothetical protein
MKPYSGDLREWAHQFVCPHNGSLLNARAELAGFSNRASGHRQPIRSAASSSLALSNVRLPSSKVAAKENNENGVRLWTAPFPLFTIAPQAAPRSLDTDNSRQRSCGSLNFASLTRLQRGQSIAPTNSLGSERLKNGVTDPPGFVVDDPLADSSRRPVEREATAARGVFRAITGVKHVQKDG